MATRAAIAIRSEAGTIYSIYCHSDGDVECVGATLAQHYTGRGDVWKLIRLGDISSLGAKLVPDPAKPHTFMERQDDVTYAYGRDRGEKGAEAKKIEGVATWKAHAIGCGAEFVYLYDEACREWFYAEVDWSTETPAIGRLRPLVPFPVPSVVGDWPITVLYLQAA